ncbi:MAG: hypothetical protein HKN68_00810 [Saprospiraceae bacterium]|nr:hypothetical protein [Saprospiraceae bacterium]
MTACNRIQDLSNTDITETTEVDYFADNGFGNAVAVVQHPAGIYHNGITYVCYQGPQEDPYVVSYNHKTSEWNGPFRAGISEMGKDETRKKKIDNHGKPSMMIDNAGYIHIAFGGHGGMKKHGENPLGNYHYGKNLHAVSKNPLDISSWETLDNISPFGTYNQFVKIDNGDIYLFYRHGAHRSDWVYQISTDNGRTFSQPIPFLKHKRRHDQAAVDSWYPWITKGKGDELSVVFDYHLCSDNNVTGSQNGHVPKRYNVYYMTFNPTTGLWKNVAGENLQAPITRELADAKALVGTTDGNWTFQGVVDIDAKGHPHIGMTIGVEVEGARKSAPKQMHYFNWNGANWIHLENAGLPIGNGDIEATSNDQVRFYIEEQSDDGLGEVARWDANKNKNSFIKTKSLLTRKGANFAISALIENPHPDARLIVAERKPGTNFRKMYLLGDNGPVKRAAVEANLLNNE